MNQKDLMAWNIRQIGKREYAPAPPRPIALVQPAPVVSSGAYSYQSGGTKYVIRRVPKR